jgi:DNA polymerase-3 subunit gamma/tau
MAKRKSSAAAEPPPYPADKVAPNRSSETGGAYTVLARRYRPQQFRDLVGQEPIAQALVNTLESNRVAHAYLFTGLRGVGKTSTARILAKALNCVHGPTATPCDQCEICQSVASGEDVDVLEIDGASNNGVEQIREIRQNVQYRPSRARYKIYIIDEVHMLSTGAFNALLKTLEEPPEHVKFIFATTSVQKIPITILSRCQRFDFAGIGTARIVERLREVTAAERKKADDDALELIARRAGGSMRDAQSLLDQLLAFGSDRLTSDQVHRMLGTAHDERIIALASAVLEHDPKRALELLGQAADEGLQLGEFLDQLIDYWRDLMMAQCAGPESPYLNTPGRHRELLARQAAGLSLDTILAGLDVLATAKSRLRGSGATRVLVEMALVRLGRLEDLASLSELTQYLGQLNSTPTAGTAGRAVNAAPGQTAPRRLSESLPPAEPLKKTSLTAAPESVSPAQLSLCAETLPQIWAQLVSQVPPMLREHLGRGGVPAISGPNTLVLRFPVGYNHEREYCQQPASLARMEEGLRRITGLAWAVRIESGGGESNPLPTIAAAETDQTLSRYRRQRSEAMKEPLVKRAMEALAAQIIDVEEGFGVAVASATEPAKTGSGNEEA